MIEPLFMELISMNEMDLLKRAYNIFEEILFNDNASTKMLFALVISGQEHRAKIILDNIHKFRFFSVN